VSAILALGIDPGYATLGMATVTRDGQCYRVCGVRSHKCSFARCTGYRVSGALTSAIGRMTMATKKAAKKAPKGKALQPVIVCSNNAVLFGRVRDPLANPLTIEGARQAYYWANPGGHFGLAGADERAPAGPQLGSRVGARGTITVTSIACVIAVTENAAKAWDEWPITTK